MQDDEDVKAGDLKSLDDSFLEDDAPAAEDVDSGIFGEDEDAPSMEEEDDNY